MFPLRPNQEEMPTLAAVLVLYSPVPSQLGLSATFRQAILREKCAEIPHNPSTGFLPVVEKALEFSKTP